MSFRTCFDPSVYFILDPSVCAGRNYIDVAYDAVRGGVSMLQLRYKCDDKYDVIHHANNLKQMLFEFHVPFIVNDYVDVALEVDADGVHLGQDDMSPQEARRILGEDKIIGLTAFDSAHFDVLDCLIVDYVGTGPIHPTLTKPDKAVLGLSGFAELLDCSSVPVVAIGGITPENAADIVSAGADGVAMMRGISEADNVEQAAYKFLNIFAASRLRDAS
ncbi:MAG: thiamine phosphate synthase [Alphaproteobacteria bacterium]|nr:thiamine phosphate synthase [Alphaproteobacteria bacterium]